MADISLCKNDGCIFRYQCDRFNLKPNEHWQSYSNFTPHESGCDGFRNSQFDLQDYVTHFSTFSAAKSIVYKLATIDGYKDTIDITTCKEEINTAIDILKIVRDNQQFDIQSLIEALKQIQQ